MDSFEPRKILWILLQVMFLLQAHSQDRGDTCRLCQQRPDACRRIAGLYTVTVLTEGTYNPVVEIPAQACSINITELARSHNHLAVRTEAGDSLVNGYWAVGSTGSFPGAGTTFKYSRGERDCPGECLTAPGPTDTRIIVQLLYYGKNPGIAYSFVLPVNVPFQPFDETAPKVESLIRTRHHHRGSHRSRQNSQGAGTVSDREPYHSGAHERAVTTEEQEPGGPMTSARRRATPASANRDPLKAQAPDNFYHGRSYGSHTLGGRGQSYTFQYIDNDDKDDEDSGRTGFQHHDDRTSLRGSQNAPDPRSGSSNTHSQRGLNREASPTYPRQHTLRREQFPVWRPPPSRNYVTAYDSDSSRGFQTAAASSRGGLVDKTFSRSIEAENRLQAFERPALSIGSARGGKEYEWTISGLTECSLTCGGGTQETQIVCVLTSSATQVVVTPDNCENALKPRVQRVACNNDPCPPSWVTGEWSACSVTCGGGTQSRRIECRQRVSDRLEISVSASHCQQDQKPAVAQQCENQPCTRWQTGQWAECSVQCGGGQRVRQVECVDGHGVQVPDTYCLEDKPADRDRCNSDPCTTQWWHTQWSHQCSADCGSGLTTRQVLCADRSGRPVSEAACQSDQRPRDRKSCEGSGGCGSWWFNGPWSPCSESCGQGIRSRQVICIKREESRGVLITVEDNQCGADSKPSIEEACLNSACGAQYYMTAWSQCSVTCGSGVKSREVRCLDERQQPSWSCDRSLAPIDREACQLSPCRESHQGARERTSHLSRSERRHQPASAALYRESDSTLEDLYVGNSSNIDDDSMMEENLENGIEDLRLSPRKPADHRVIDENCKDIFWNCQLVVQARLCSYNYYQKVCCAACRRVA